MKYVIRCNSFDLASRVAAERNFHLSEWQWLPYYTIHDTIEVYALESETTSRELKPRSQREYVNRLRDEDKI